MTSLSIPLILLSLLNDLPEIWAVAQETTEAVAVEFAERPAEKTVPEWNAYKRQQAIEGLIAWYNLVDKKLQFDDLTDVRFKTLVIPYLVNLAWHDQKEAINARLSLMVGQGLKPFSDLLKSFQDGWGLNKGFYLEFKQAFEELKGPPNVAQRLLGAFGIEIDGNARVFDLIQNRELDPADGPFEGYPAELGFSQIDTDSAPLGDSHA